MSVKNGVHTLSYVTGFRNIKKELVKKYGISVAELLSILLHIPGLKTVMLKAFSKMLTSFFGEDAEFKSIKYCEH